MATLTVEDRLVALEREVAQLRMALTNAKSPGDYRSTYGMFTGDEMMKRIDREALKYRERDRAKAKRRTRSRQRTKT